MQHQLLPGVMLLLCGSLLSVEPADIYQDGFRKKDHEACFINGKGLKKNAASFLDRDKTVVFQSPVAFLFRKVPVKADVKYRLTFSACQEGAESIEKNPGMARKIFQHRENLFPVCRLLFFDKDGKRLPTDTHFFAVPFETMTQQTLVFHAPPRAESMQLSMGVPKGCRVTVAEPSLKEETEEKTWNINPKFELGIHNYSGIAAFNDKAGCLITDESGKTQLFTGFYAVTNRFPLKEPGSYLLTMRGTGYNRNRVDSILTFFDAAGKKTATAPVPRLLPQNKGTLEFRFIRPKNAAYASLTIYHATISEISVTSGGAPDKK